MMRRMRRRMIIKKKEWQLEQDNELRC